MFATAAYVEIVVFVPPRCGVSSDGAFGKGIAFRWRQCQKTCNGERTKVISDEEVPSKCEKRFPCYSEFPNIAQTRASRLELSRVVHDA